MFIHFFHCIQSRRERLRITFECTDRNRRCSLLVHSWVQFTQHRLFPPNKGIGDWVNGVPKN